MSNYSLETTVLHRKEGVRVCLWSLPATEKEGGSMQEILSGGVKESSSMRHGIRILRTCNLTLQLYTIQHKC